MNTELLNPYAQDYPEGLVSSFDASATCARFNPSGLFAGQYLAIGRQDGLIYIVDTLTKTPLRVLEGHARAVVSTCWSRNSRYLLTASRDWNALIWDLSEQNRYPDRFETVRFDAPLISATFHPRTSKIIAVILALNTNAIIVEIDDGAMTSWECSMVGEEDPNVPSRGGNGGGAANIEADEEEEEEEETQKQPAEVATVCRFNPTGDLVYVGTSKGAIYVFETMTKALRSCDRDALGSTASIKGMEFDATGSALVVNMSDRCIRVVRLLTRAELVQEELDEADGSDVEMDEGAEREPPPEVNYTELGKEIPGLKLQHKLLDLVNKTPWSGCDFSSNGEYVIGGADNKGAHAIYIWDRQSGGLFKILEGPKDPIIDLQWHPTRPLLASVSVLGHIYLWATNNAENWSSYAPGFEELDENALYPEREDEFDIEDENAVKRREADEQDKFIDILNIKPKSKGGAIAAAPPSAAAPEAEDAYELWIAERADDDTSANFYPPVDLEEKEVEVILAAEAAGTRGTANGGTPAPMQSTEATPVPDESIGNKRRKGKKK